MTRWSEADHRDFLNKQNAKAAKPAKYRNVKVIVDGLQFDSKHEAHVFRELQLREKAGEIRDVRVQVPFRLVTFAQARNQPDGLILQVAEYIADFTYDERVGEDGWRSIVADAKSAATKNNAIYRLKKKWLALQDGIEIVEL